MALSARNNPAIGEFLGGKGYEARGMTYANTRFIDRALLNYRFLGK